MNLGADSISIEVAGEVFELRPTLRAALRLTRQYGLQKLATAVQDFNLTIVMDMLREAGIPPATVAADIDAIGLGTVRERIASSLFRHVLALGGIDPDQTDTKPAPATETPLTPEQLHTRLFEIATGWLGWTPEQAWTATPSEIIAAKAGRTDLITDVLKAVFGGDEQTATTPARTPEQIAAIEAAGMDPTFDRAGLQALKAKIARST